MASGAYVSGLEPVTEPQSGQPPELEGQHPPHYIHGLPPQPQPDQRFSIQKPPLVDANRTETPEKIAGLRRTTFWLILALVLVVVAAAVLGGVLGGILSTRNKASVSQESGSPHAVTSSAPTSAISLAPSEATDITSLRTSPTSPSGTSSSITLSASSTTGPGGVVVECPALDNTTYSPPDYPSQTFLRECGANWGAVDGAIDVSSPEASNMEDCINFCARFNDDPDAKSKCVGVTWVYQGPQGTDFNYC